MTKVNLIILISEIPEKYRYKDFDKKQWLRGYIFHHAVSTEIYKILIQSLKKGKVIHSECTASNHEAHAAFGNLFYKVHAVLLTTEHLDASWIAADMAVL